MQRPLRLLIVEDSKALGERLTELVSQLGGFELLGVVDNENDAVTRIRNESVEVMLLDLHLRQGTGFGVLRSLKGSTDRPQVVVLTTYDLPEYKNAALALGARFFLDKARDSDRIPEVLDEISRDARGTNQPA